MKTLLFKSNLLIKPSIVLATAVLTAVSFLAPSVRAADPAYLMPTGLGGGHTDDGIQPFDPNPAAPGSITRKFLTYGKDADGNTIPLKTLRITNNTTQTIYPIIRDPNSIGIVKDSPIDLYDPYDPTNQEYRGYIGYQEGGKYYFGLKQGESILVSIPLVFWNAARIGIGTDGQYLTTTSPNPLRYDPNAFRSIANAETSNDTIPNGVVMWYRAGIAQAPNDDTEDQLAEWTIRDHSYLVNPKITARTNNQIPDNQLVTLINYDVSNVDNLYLPVAMEATDVWVIPQSAGTGPNANRDGWKAGRDPDVFGWTGAIDSINFLQTRIKQFTEGDNKTPNTLLGWYFGGKGWPYYNIPNPTNDPNPPVKIPSGANVFAQSPLKNTPSSYQTPDWQTVKYMLSSGGTEPISATVGWAGGTPDPVGSTTLHLFTGTAEAREKIAFLGENYVVTGRPPCSPGSTPVPPKDCERLTNPIQDGTTVSNVDKTAGIVTLSKPLVSTSESCAFTFSRPVDDYASEAMIKLWYSWAQYYLVHWKDNTPMAPTAPTTIHNCSIDVRTATLSFTTAHPELVEGMAVTGPGLDDAMTEVGIHQGDAVILEIASDKKSVTLSQVANKKSTDEDFTFHPPKPLLWTPATATDPGYPLFVLDFSADNLPAWHDPYEFSQQVYLVMASMNQIGHPNNDSVSKYMQDIVGANMGYIFTNAAKQTDETQTVIAIIRDKIKSVLRGVSDFTKYPDTVDNDGNHTTWYPDPKKQRGGRTFNVFNLDPFVWFVHVTLGFSGYGFSVDDDTGDIGAGGATQLRITVAGTGGLTNTKPWTIQAPYGPVKNVLLPYSGPQTVPDEGNTLYNAIKSISNDTPIKISTKATQNLSNGALVKIDQVNPNVYNGIFKIGNVSTKTFELFNKDTGLPVPPPNVTYVSGGRWSYYPPHPYIDTGADLTKVFYRVTGDDALGTFLGTFVTVNGVDSNKTTKEKFRVWQLGRQDVGRLLLWADLTDANGTPLPAGTYTFTFSGMTETGNGPGGPPPFKLGAIREDIHEEIDRVENKLHRLEKQNSETKQSERKTRWMQMRIAVLTARLQYPTDEVLRQLEQTVEARGSLGRKAYRTFLDQLNARLAELWAGN
jgi:hypothetical protein